MSPTGLKRSTGGGEQNVAFALVIAFFVNALGTGGALSLTNVPRARSDGRGTPL
jgi:hypothetical protein